jgi:hypothetical protein
MSWRLEKRDDWPPESRQFSLPALFGVGALVGREQRLLGYRLVRSPAPANSSA